MHTIHIYILYIKIKYKFKFKYNKNLIHTSKHISDSTNILLCVLFEQQAKSVG